MAWGTAVMEADDGLSGAGACDALAHLTDDERKRYACAPFLDEPACSEFRAALRTISDLRGQLRAARGELAAVRDALGGA